MIAKRCDLCGRLYSPYNSMIEEIDPPETSEETLEEETTELLDDELNTVVYNGEMETISPEPNGFQFLTMDPQDGIQYEHPEHDVCRQCMAVLEGLVTTLSEAGLNLVEPDDWTSAVSVTRTANSISITGLTLNNVSE